MLKLTGSCSLHSTQSTVQYRTSFSSMGSSRLFESAATVSRSEPRTRLDHSFEGASRLTSETRACPSSKSDGSRAIDAAAPEAATGAVVWMGPPGVAAAEAEALLEPVVSSAESVGFPLPLVVPERAVDAAEAAGEGDGAGAGDEAGAGVPL